MKKMKVFAVLLMFVLLVSVVFSPEVVSAKPNKANKTTKPTKITLNVKNKSIYVNQTFELKVAKVKPSNASVTVTWTSSNPKVATVDEKGVVTAVKAGTAKITASATTNKKIKASCVVKVKKFKPTKITAKVIKITSSKDYLRMAGYETKTITTYTELKAFMNEASDKYVAAGYGTKKDFKKTKFYVQLKKYSKGFFKTKVLYLLEGSTIGKEQKVKVRQVTKVLAKDGDFIGKLAVTYSPVPEKPEPSTKTYYQQYFVEVKKSTAKTLDEVELAK